MGVYKCNNCNQQFESKKGCKSRQPKFCSNKCYGESLKIDKTKKCATCSKIFETYKKNQKFCSQECMGKHFINRQVSKETRRKLSKSLTGRKCESISKANHWNWKGGVTDKNEAIRKSAEYKNWRIKVFEKDNYTCVECGIKSGLGKRVELHADHIKPFAHYHHLRFDVSNGRTLCKECHYKTDTFGGKSINYETAIS